MCRYDQKWKQAPLSGADVVLACCAVEGAGLQGRLTGAMPYYISKLKKKLHTASSRVASNVQPKCTISNLTDPVIL